MEPAKIRYDNETKTVKPLNRQIIYLEFSLTGSCVSLTRSTASSEWKLFRFDKMEVNHFEILLIHVTFYLQHVQKLVFDALIIIKLSGPAVKGFTHRSSCMVSRKQETLKQCCFIVGPLSAVLSQRLVSRICRMAGSPGCSIWEIVSMVSGFLVDAAATSSQVGCAGF